MLPKEIIIIFKPFKTLLTDISSLIGNSSIQFHFMLGELILL